MSLYVNCRNIAAQFHTQAPEAPKASQSSQATRGAEQHRCKKIELQVQMASDLHGNWLRLLWIAWTARSCLTVSPLSCLDCWILFGFHCIELHGLLDHGWLRFHWTSWTAGSWLAATAVSGMDYWILAGCDSAELHGSLDLDWTATACTELHGLLDLGRLRFRYCVIILCHPLVCHLILYCIVPRHIILYDAIIYYLYCFILHDNRL